MAIYQQRKPRFPSVTSPSFDMHEHTENASAWVERWAPLIAHGGRVLDVASGAGRNVRWLAARGHPVDAIDRDAEALRSLADVPGVHTLCADIEGGAWPCERGAYAGVIVTNYLHRPLFPELLAALAPGGVLIYETFAAGNERYGRPSNPAFLLEPGELLEVVRGRLRVVAYEDVKVMLPSPQGEGKSTGADAPVTLKSALVQRICAIG